MKHRGLFSLMILVLAICVAGGTGCSYGGSGGEGDGGVALDGAAGSPGVDGSNGAGSGADGGSAGASGTDGSAAGSSGSGDGGSGESGPDGGTAGQGGEGDGGQSPACGIYGDPCAKAEDCCSGICDPDTGTCVSSLTRCAPAGAECDFPTECCSLVCAGGKCQDEQCLSDGETCSDSTECCSTICEEDICQALNLECKTAGNGCSSDAECCSRLCTDGRCNLSASFCIQQGDICAQAEDCCTGRCEIADGRDVGICGPPPSGSSFCNDGVDGLVCDACNECCSRLCIPYGPTGVLICQPASGCHVTGDFCRTDQDCCGAPGTGLPGEGNVSCQKEPGSDLGICRNPQSCSPQGNVCHYKDYVCGVSSARANCCGGTGSKSGVCQLDPLGVPRCNGLGDECVPPGDICASSDDCCDDVPCVPDAQGVLRCMYPPDGGGTACVPVNGPCTIDADCCPGSICIRPLGSTQGTCGNYGPPGDGGVGDGGTLPDGGTPPGCALYGQSCVNDGDCCNDVPCTDGICRVPIG